jgi:hypothetical protein
VMAAAAAARVRECEVRAECKVTRPTPSYGSKSRFEGVSTVCLKKTERSMQCRTTGKT